MFSRIAPDSELEILSWVTQEIGLSTNVADRLDQLVTRLQQVIPCDRCVIIHEREGGAISGGFVYRYGTPPDRPGSGRSQTSFGPPVGIGAYLECFSNSAHLDDAFVWRETGHAPGAVCLAIRELLSHMQRSEGVAASVRSPSAGSDDAATLLQLECTGQPVSARQTLLTRFVAFCLHSSFLLNWASAFPNERSPEINLTCKERDVLRWMVEGKTSWEIGRILSTSERTVKFHLKNVYTKLNVSNRAQAATVVNRLGLV